MFHRAPLVYLSYFNTFKTMFSTFEKKTYKSIIVALLMMLLLLEMTKFNRISSKVHAGPNHPLCLQVGMILLLHSGSWTKLGQIVEYLDIIHKCGIVLDTLLIVVLKKLFFKVRRNRLNPCPDQNCIAISKVM